MKAWPGDLPVGMLGDLPAMFSSVTGRGEFTFHIWILGPSEMCAVNSGWIEISICKSTTDPSTVRAQHLCVGSVKLYKKLGQAKCVH